MTQTIAFKGSAEINPLYIKMRRRFACQDNRTVGEMKAQEAIRDGFSPYAVPAHRHTVAAKTSSFHLTRANSLPNRTPASSFKLSFGALAAIMVCSILLILLLFSGSRIAQMRTSLSVSASAPSESFSVSAEESVDEESTALSNLLLAFSQD